MELFDFNDKWKELVDKAYSEGYDKLTPQERVWFNVQSLIQDGDNGGLISHYYNSGADTLDDTMEDLEKLDAKEVVDIIKQINQLFPDAKPSKDIDKRNEIINSWDTNKVEEHLRTLDETFYKEEKKLEDKLVNFITENRLV